MIEPLVEYKDEVVVKQFDEDADGYMFMKLWWIKQMLGMNYR